MSATADCYYDRGYHSTHYKALYERDDYYQARAELALAYFTAEERQARVFDYGCGLGHAISLLPHAEGWDISAEAREACRRRGIRVYDNSADIPRGAFDVVFNSHVLEHVEEPLSALRTMRELLKPGGTLLLVVPKEEHWLPRVEQPDVNQHLYCWTPQTIYNLLWRAGFRPGRAEYRYPFGGLKLMPLRRIFGPRLYHAASRAGVIFKRNGEIVVRATRVDDVGLRKN
jgi:SAM-dependent methyltransferase